MKNAAEATYEDYDEEGSAELAASLGADGGPSAGAGDELAVTDDDLDEIADFDEEAWLDEELTDEELAALGEEDFDEGEFLDDASGDQSAIEAGYSSFDEQLEEDLTAEIENNSESTDLAEVDLEEEFGADDETSEQSIAATSGAVVTANTVVTNYFEDDNEVALYEDEEDDEHDHRPVPRISIQAFCETPETTALLEKAAIDRRLSKAHVTMHMGGISKAVSHFQTAATPNLVILETVAGGPELFGQLGELAEVCDPSTKVIIIGKVNDIGLYRELVRQGISDYIVRPKSPLQLIKSIATLYVDPSAPPIGRTIAFVGARGGVGSSTIAHNIGWCIAEEQGSDTVILDLDLPFGTASLDFEQDPTSGLIEALGSPERLDDVLLDRLLQKHTEHLSLFTAPNLLDRDYDLDDQAFETVIDVVRGAAPTIIIDVPHTWTSWSKRILQTADEIVITATPDLASFRNTKNLVDVLSGSRPNDSAPTFVLNQFDPKTSAVQPAQFEEHIGIKPALILNYEAQLFNTAATNAAPIAEVGPKTKTTQGIRELSARLLGREGTFQTKPRFSLSGLFKKR